MSKELVKKFSKRQDEIDRKTKELLEREPDKATRNLQEIRANIAHNERARKIKDVGLTKLQSLWHEQMSSGEKSSGSIAGVQRVRFKLKRHGGTVRAMGGKHLFERRSVVHEHELWRHALEHSRGQNVSLAEIQIGHAAARLRPRQTVSRQADNARSSPARNEHCLPWLNTGCNNTNRLRRIIRRQTLHWMMSSARRSNIFCPRAISSRCFAAARGRAKVSHCEKSKPDSNKAGHVVQVLAPQRQQVSIWKRTVLSTRKQSALSLARRSMPRGAVVIVDEAGQIGGEQMQKLLSLVKENEGRVILSGDTRQHGAVEASDALRAIERYSGLGCAGLTNIRRQNPATAKTQAERHWLEQYKLAVDEAQQGKLAASFDRLDKQGAIVPCSLADQQQKLTEHFLELVKDQA